MVLVVVVVVVSRRIKISNVRDGWGLAYGYTGGGSASHDD